LKEGFVPVSGDLLRSPARRHSLALLVALGIAWPLACVAPARAQTPPGIDLNAATADISYGSPHAKVTVVEYASLACSHCADFHVTMWPTFKKDFVDTGEVRLIFKDYPLNAPGIRAHMLMRCLGGARGEAIKDLLFKSQRAWINQNYMTHLAQTARLAGMSQAQFDACMASKPLEDFLVKSQYTGQQSGVQGTPTFIVNGKTIITEAKLEYLVAAVTKAGAKRKAE
jgi:protein-disulfide isomerase